MRRLWALCVAGLLLVGCGSKERLCADCTKIRALQDKADKTVAEQDDLKALKTQVATSQSAAYYVDVQLGKGLPDLHPGCDCECHRYWTNPDVKVH